MFFSRQSRSLKAGLFCSAVILVAGSLSTALAVPPLKGAIGPVDIESEFIGDCGGYAVLANFTLGGHFVQQFDKDGIVRRVNTHLSFTESIYYGSYEADYSDPAFFLTGQGEVQNERFELDVSPPIVALTGGPYRVTVPGSGVIFQEGGRILINLATGEIISSSGPSDNLDGNVAALCAALAP